MDLTAIPGVSVGTVRVFLGELGPDLSRFPTAGALASWLGLCPANEITGGKILKSSTRRGVNRLTAALRMAAESLCRDKSYLGQFYRRMRARVGGPEAITAAAHKMARILYHLITHREEYDESRFMEIEQRNLERLKLRLDRQARRLGYALVQA